MAATPPTKTVVTRASTTATTTITVTWVDRFLDLLRHHRLPPPLEIVLAWWVAIGCLIYYGYSYLRHCHPLSSTSTTTVQHIPLVVPVRRRSVPQITAPQELCRTIQQILFIAGEQQQQQNNINDNNENTIERGLLVLSSCQNQQHTRMLASSMVVNCIRRSVELRRLVSDFMSVMDRYIAETENQNNNHSSNSNTTKEPSTLSENDPVQELYQFLDRVWLDLLRFPSVHEGWNSPMEISLIVPAYRETVANLQTTLICAWKNCAGPMAVQVIVVDAGITCRSTTSIGDTAAATSSGDDPTEALQQELMLLKAMAYNNSNRTDSEYERLEKKIRDKYADL